MWKLHSLLNARSSHLQSKHFITCKIPTLHLPASGDVTITDYIKGWFGKIWLQGVISSGLERGVNRDYILLFVLSSLSFLCEWCYLVTQCSYSQSTAPLYRPGWTSFCQDCSSNSLEHLNQGQLLLGFEYYFTMKNNLFTM